MRIAKQKAITAYKAFNKDWTCHGFQYKVGKEYKINGKIELCKKGFHSCFTPSECFVYYPFDPKETKFAEVKIWGEVVREEDSTKCCSSKIFIVRDIKWNEVLTLCNSGFCNSGCWNSGDGNSGNYNSGDWNSGKCNSGNYNSGDWNSGKCNSGRWNSGNWNSGDGNSGRWNSGRCNSGYFNTASQNKIFCFNKLTDKQEIDFPEFLYFNLIKWIDIKSMSESEKKAHPECKVIGGYLKKYEYKEAFRNSFLKAKQKLDWKEELAKLKDIPNFDYAIFEEISGITKEELEK